MNMRCASRTADARMAMSHATKSIALSHGIIAAALGTNS